MTGVASLEKEKPYKPSGRPVVLPKFGRVTIGVNIGTLFVALMFSVPLLWLVLAACDSQATQELQWPHFSTINFQHAMAPDLMWALLNSVIISGIATAVATIPAFFGAYSFSRHRLPSKNVILFSILFLAGVPISILIIPIFEVFQSWNLLSLLPASIILGITCLPFELYIIKNAIDAIPLDLEEAARIEKASTLRILFKIILPISLPGIAAAAIYGFIMSWGNFLIPIVLISSSEQQPSPAQLFGFISSVSCQYGTLAAYCIIYSFPVVALYLASSRIFTAGFKVSRTTR
ncbi:carbohydrate ABC transporter permease [Acidisoma cellulosilytica]|uniref:Carbohydrate ABC transporter permease n=1 Tax=Acidisoma cellulosilyticum TaxID=2802395 RepID=A0A963Z8D4_9PROT|nr:carbohydrate ABC transporter permease [Acidisoma cellulosilyticum]MCB8883733.1 carbohydrate ABC transporter permease [Acidisoma cellulosilyticum]